MQITFLIVLIIPIVVGLLTINFMAHAPVAREKRRYVAVLLVTVLIQSIVVALEFTNLDWALLIPFVLLSSVSVIQFLLLRRLDYYLDEILHELMLLTLLCTSVLVQEVYWNWGIDNLFSGIALRLGIVAIALATLGFIGVIAQAKYYRWTVLAFVVLLLVKWISFPYWGLWFSVMALIYSLLVGYVAHWQTMKTRAEIIYADNTNTSLVWIVLLAVATVIVVSF